MENFEKVATGSSCVACEKFGFSNVGFPQRKYFRKVGNVINFTLFIEFCEKRWNKIPVFYSSDYLQY